MGRRAAPIARWVKRQSGGRTKLVQLGRKAANVADDFDLAVTCTHFQLPAHPKRIDLLLPPTQVTAARLQERSEEHTSELQSLMRISYAVFCLKKKKRKLRHTIAK